MSFTNFTYNEKNLLLTAIYTDDKGEISVSTHTYNDKDQLVTKVHQFGTNKVTENHTYDDRGNLIYKEVVHTSTAPSTPT